MLALRRRHPRRADDGAAAARADRQGARRAALPGRHGVRRRAGRRRARRQAGRAGVQRASASARCGRRCRGSFNLFRTERRLHRRRAPASFPNATLNVDISPEYMGVGYVIGPRIAGDDVRRRRAVVAGAAAAAVDPRRVHHRAVPADPPELREQPGDRPAVPDLGDERRRRSGAPTSATSAPARCWRPASSRWRRTLPTIVSSAREGMKDFGAGAGGAARSAPSATCR